MIRQQIKGENMVENITLVWTNLIASIGAVTSIIWGRVLIVILFIGATFAPISGLIHTILILIGVDLIFGLTVTIRKKGIDEIVSNKLRNSLFKAMFYLLFIMMSFLVEKQIAGSDCLVTKVVFAVMGAVELWSIAGNALILSPNLPFLRLLKKYLTSEIAKKMEIDKKDVDEILNKKNKDK